MGNSVGVVHKAAGDNAATERPPAKINLMKPPLIQSDTNTTTGLSTDLSLIPDAHEWTCSHILCENENEQNHNLCVTSVAFSHDGQQLVSGTLDNAARVWDIKSETVLRLMENEGEKVFRVAFEQGSSKITCTSIKQKARHWEAASSRTFESNVMEHQNNVTCAVSSPNGKLIVYGLRTDSCIYVWDTVHQQPFTSISEHTETVTALAFREDGTQLVSASDDCSIRVWDVASAKIVTKLGGLDRKVCSIAINPLGTRIVAGLVDGCVMLWDGTTTKLLCTFQGQQLPDYVGSMQINSIVFSPDSEQIACGSDDGLVRLWNIGDITPTEAVLIGHKKPVSSVVFSPDGKLIASGSWDRTIRIWSNSKSSSNENPSPDSQRNRKQSVASKHVALMKQISRAHISM
mmetsp:Transcript_21997/g.36854  ORF Transcript_21997/g.36854 Transcript_21997/m.36854 type:complete len:403 (-) Transcript_21997:408-1616(-)|eukprot:CAMPEP_0175025396 /NCGR_PEP_ID=MMETSP0005-20121125/17089_1 /TAXON_ID=420556 /ORGANISM="Ochromonas sp., Strain CCMP1393" /LENGTH=402 /DNA_ID=CAMNT_0016284235 /DNA_START=51 /DNA_END=1259 /DNA_ORIENTATION=-